MARECLGRSVDAHCSIQSMRSIVETKEKIKNFSWRITSENIQELFAKHSTESLSAAHFHNWRKRGRRRTQRSEKRAQQF